MIFDLVLTVSFDGEQDTLSATVLGLFSMLNQSSKEYRQQNSRHPDEGIILSKNALQRSSKFSVWA